MLNSKGFTLIELFAIMAIFSIAGVVTICIIYSSRNIKKIIKTIDITFTIKGNSSVKITYIDTFGSNKEIEKDINGAGSFELQIPTDTDVTIKWESKNNNNVEVDVSYILHSKTISGDRGEWSFKTPTVPTDCFIQTIKKPWLLSKASISD